MPEVTRARAANVALVLAIVSSLAVAAAIIVTVARSHARTERSRHPRADRIDAAGALVRATDLLRLDGTVESSGAGIRLTDHALAGALRLRDADVITAISGRIVRGATDVKAAINAMFMLDPSVVYVDLVRDGKPLLLKWQVDGNVRDALADQHRNVPKTMRSGSLPFVPNGPIDPFATAHAPSDPIVASVTNLDIDHYAVPADTFRTLFDDPMTAMTNGIIATVRRVPTERDNRTINRLFGMRPSSIWYALGLRNGDVVLGANGRPVGFASIFDDTRHLANADTIDLEIDRAGTSIHLRYDITR